MLLQNFGDIQVNAPAVTWAGFFGNLVPVILGDIVGGVFWWGWCTISSTGRKA